MCYQCKQAMHCSFVTSVSQATAPYLCVAIQEALGPQLVFLFRRFPACAVLIRRRHLHSLLQAQRSREAHEAVRLLPPCALLLPGRRLLKQPSCSLLVLFAAS